MLYINSSRAHCPMVSVVFYLTVTFLPLLLPDEACWFARLLDDSYVSSYKCLLETTSRSLEANLQASGLLRVIATPEVLWKSAAG